MKALISFLFIVFFQINLIAQQTESDYLVRSTISTAGSSENIFINNSSYIIQQSIGQGSVIGTFNESDYVVRQGFIQPNVLAKIIDKEIPLNLEAIIYPNPFKESVTISFKEKILSKVFVNVYDMLGRLVYRKNFTANQEIKVQLLNLSQESYILKVTANKKQQIEKILKIRE